MSGVLYAISPVGILLNAGLFLYLGWRLHVLAGQVGELASRVSVLEDRHEKEKAQAVDRRHRR